MSPEGEAMRALGIEHGILIKINADGGSEMTVLQLSPYEVAMILCMIGIEMTEELRDAKARQN